MAWFRNLRLGNKISLIIALTAVLLATVILSLEVTGTNHLIDDVGRLRIQQEALLVERHLAEEQNSLETTANLFSNTPGLVQAVVDNNVNVFEQLAGSVLEELAIDDFDIINAAGERLIDSEEILSDDEGGENDLLEQTLLGVQQTTMISEQREDETEVFLMSTRPLRDDSGTIVGGFLIARELNSNFLDSLNFDRPGIELSLVQNGLVIAKSSTVNTVEDVDHDDEEITLQSQLVVRALLGNVAINPEIVYSNTGIPYTEAYIPVQGFADNAPSAVVLVRVSNEPFALFQSDLFNTSGVAIAVVVALGIAFTIAFVRLTISRRIYALQQAATTIAQGNYDERAHVLGQDEVGQLAEAFNTMAGDIQQRRLELVELNQTLEDRVEERTHELKEARDTALVAQRLAQESSRVKSEFLSTMSHELRTPLNAIIGFSDMLLAGMSGPLSDKQVHKMERLKENGVRLLALINDLLDLTRIEAGRVEVVAKEYSPRDLAARMTEQMESLAVESQLNFETIVSPDVPETVWGDEKRVEQVVVNLLSNAFKFTNEGSVTLNIGANQSDGTWSIEVTDTGVGIPPHAVNVIFEEFRQIDGGYTRAYKGSGLGLAITRNLVRIMDGKIGLQSTLGSGSTFTVVLPISKQEMTQPMTLEAVAS